MNRKILQLTILALLVAVAALPAFAEGISRDQGDIIISELRQIRQLLERQKGGGEAPAAAVPTPPQRVRLKLGQEYSLGKADAPLTMVEYTDFQCPFCSRFHSGTFPEIKKQYIDAGKVRFISRDYPLEFHPYAMKAAQATHCAGEQDKFWQMKDALMTNSASLTPDLITSLARDNGVDMTKFQSCMDSGKYQDVIKNELAAANAIGINGTPSFVIGKVTGDTLDGLLIVGAQPFGEFDRVFKELEAGSLK
jgi:protein-disulfide isomerase